MKSWTQTEDQALISLYKETPSFRRWKNICSELQKIGIFKTQYQCRERYINKLDPSVNQQKWEEKQIKMIFQHYNQCGSQWSMIQKSMPGRTQNGIKNKFYCTLRNFLRGLFKFQKSASKSIVQNLTSNKLTAFYQGKKEFKKFKGFAKRCLKSLNYRIASAEMSNLLEEESQRIKQLYKLLSQKRNNIKLKKKQKQQDLSEQIVLNQQQEKENINENIQLQQKLLKNQLEPKNQSNKQKQYQNFLTKENININLIQDDNARISLTQLSPLKQYPPFNFAHHHQQTNNKIDEQTSKKIIPTTNEKIVSDSKKQDLAFGTQFSSFRVYSNSN